MAGEGISGCFKPISVTVFLPSTYHILPLFTIETATKNPKKKRETKPNCLISLDFSLGDPYGTRTRVTGVRGQRPRPLDEGAMLCAIF